MENLIQNIPMAAALVLPVVLVLMVVTLLAFFAACQIMGVAVTWYMVVAAIILGVFVAYAAMFGFDKLKQTLEQINSIKQNK